MLPAVTGNVAHGHVGMVVELGFDNAYWRFDSMEAGTQSAEMRECDHEADGSMAAHTQVADVVKKDDACGAGAIDRLAQQSPYNGVGTAWLIDDGRAQMIEVTLKKAQPVGERAVAEGRPTTEDKPSGFATSMGIDNMNPLGIRQISGYACANQGASGCWLFSRAKTA